MLRREVPTVICFFFGTMMILDFFVPHHRLKAVAGDVQQWATIVVAFAFVLGGLNILGIHLGKVARRKADWPYSLVTVAAMLLMLGVGVQGKDDDDPAKWLYDATFSPLGSTVFSLLCFFIASASFRAFRIRNWQAGTLAITAMVVMLGAVPLSTALLDAVVPGAGAELGLFRTWIMGGLQNAGKAAILIGVALGTVATGVKIILGIERPYGSD